MRKNSWIVLVVLVAALAACQPANEVPAVNTTMQPAILEEANVTAQVKPTIVPTLAPTRTPTAAQPTATATESVSGFQQMMRSLPTKEYVAAFYPESVEIKYYEYPIVVSNRTFGFIHVLEPGLYLDKRFDIENQWAAYEGYHPSPDYTLALYAKFAEGEATLENVQRIAMEDQLNSAARFGELVEQDSEIVTIIDRQVVISWVVTESQQGMLQFLTLDSLHDHLQGGVMEVSIMSAFLRENKEELADMAEDVREVLIAMFSSFETVDVANELTYDYTLYTGLCPTETDESYGYSVENPVRMIVMPQDGLEQAFYGPYMVSAYFENLLYEGQPVTYARLGSTTVDESILDMYEVSAPGMIEPVILYVDQYSQDYFKVPAGFGCSGLMYPDLFIEE